MRAVPGRAGAVLCAACTASRSERIAALARAGACRGAERREDNMEGREGNIIQQHRARVG
jgi:hypothetical protein